MGRSKRKNDDALVDPLAFAPLQTVLDHLGVKETDWDVVIIGDGSGSDWQSPCGWASVLIDKETRNRKVFYGAIEEQVFGLGPGYCLGCCISKDEGWIYYGHDGVLLVRSWLWSVRFPRTQPSE